MSKYLFFLFNFTFTFTFLGPALSFFLLLSNFLIQRIESHPIFFFFLYLISSEILYKLIALFALVHMGIQLIGLFTDTN